ncbi:MAG TPA: corrinoid protein [Candidatus Limnocylindrales bacterium]
MTQAVIDGNRAAAVELTRSCLDAGEAPGSIIENRLVPGMAIVGERFKNDEIFVPEMLISARAMKESVAVLEPLLAKTGFKAAHTAVIGTIEGDLHDIGKNLVGMMWKGAGFEVVDLGVNVPAARFAEAAVEHGAHIVGLSALLTTTMPNMGGVVEAVRASGSGAKVVIGGAPTTPEFAAQIGADGHAPDAGAAVELARRLLAR